MICRLCLEDLSQDRFQNTRKVCRSCRIHKQRNPETRKLNNLRATRKRSLNQELWNQKMRDYRIKRKESNNPIIRNCKSDKYRKSGKFKFWMKAEVRRIHGSLCFYCKDFADTIDHVIPLVRGGNNELENLVPACRSCNSSKQDKLVSEWKPKRKEGYPYRDSVCR